MAVDNTDGLISLQSGLVPNNLNPRGWVTDNHYIKGAPQTFGSLDDLIRFHPFKMSAGMSATVINFPVLGNVSSFRLIKEPNLLIDDSKESTITLENYELAWELVDTVQSTAVTVYMYAPDGPAGGAPIYPYSISSEQTANWQPIFDANKGHRWMRFRTDEIDANDDGLYDNWTQPIRVSDSYTSGDYIENRFNRFIVDDAIHENLDVTNTLIVGKSYAVNEGLVIKTIDSDVIHFGIGAIFQYIVDANISYVFGSSKLQETVPPPPRTINGIPNNKPSDWLDVVPAGTDQLWQIWAQKSVYGELKSDWRIKRVNEDANFIRYNNDVSKHPDGIVDINTDAENGSAGDVALIDAGWVTAYDNHVFMAQRELISTGPNLYTTWQLQKIDEESGEYTDNVFKLFDLNLDSDDPILEAPLTRNALNEGWSDTPVVEPIDGTKVNYISTCRKFFDGTLKTPWSSPVAYTGKDSWIDTITSAKGDDFKYDKDNNVTPVIIILTSKLFKGLAQMWISNNISYVWEIVFNNGGNGIQPDTPDATAGLQGGNPLFYYSLGNGLPSGDPNRIQDGQIVNILPDAVDGKVVIKCTQTIEISAGNTLEFFEEFSILDITDGNDAKALVLNTDTYVIAYDDPTTSLSPSTVGLRGYFSNLIKQSWQWWIDENNSGTWIELTVATPGYSINGLVLDFTTNATNLHWSQDNIKQENRFAVTNYPMANGNDPDNPSTDPLDEHFRDIVSITKLAGGGGVDGISPTSTILTNETHTVVLNTTDGLSQSGQIGSGSPASTKVMFYEGTTKRLYRATPNPNEWVITSVVAEALDSDGNAVNTDVIGGFAGIDGQSEAEVFVSQWLSSNFPIVTISAQLTINISYNGAAYTKIFTLGTSLDAPGAVILDIDSDKGFVFDINDRTNKLLTANVIDDTSNLSNADFHFNWFIENDWQGYGPKDSNTRILTHTNIRNNSDVKVAISTNDQSDPEDAAYRKRSVRFSDVLDGKIYIFWNSVDIKPVKPVGNGRDNISLPNGWYRQDDVYWNTNIPKWASDGQEDVTTPNAPFNWSPVYQIGAEAGSQGENGGFEMSMYQRTSSATPSLPASPRTISSMNTSGWSATVPVPASNTTIFVTRRFYKGEYLGEIVQFDSANEPIWGTVKDDNNLTNAAKVLGDWSAPKALIITPATPNPGPPGPTGDTGWSPVLATVIINTTKTVLQLKNWIGDADILTKPGYINWYIGTTGFVSNSADAVNIKGDSGLDSNTHLLRTYYDNKFRSVSSSSGTGYYFRTILFGEVAPKTTSYTYWEIILDFKKNANVQVTVEAWLSGATSASQNNVLYGRDIIPVNEYGRYSNTIARFSIHGNISTTSEIVRGICVRVKGNVTSSTMSIISMTVNVYEATGKFKKII